MALNEIFKKAEHLSLPVAADVPAGVPVRVGVLNGFTETPEGAGVGNIEGYASLNLIGAFKVEVAGALTKGQEVFITPAGALTATAGTGNFSFGASLSDKGAGTGLAVIAVAKFGINSAATA